MIKLHLNCDAGENDGIDLSSDFDDAFRCMSAANIACGGHAGNQKIIAETTALCLRNNVQIGLHPSYEDRANFGRVVVKLSSEKLYDSVIRQLEYAAEVIDTNGGNVVHVKPHGAMYNQTAIDESQCQAVYKAVFDIDQNLTVFGLPGTYHQEVAAAFGLKFCAEGFGDRTYQSSKALRSRKYEDSILTDSDKVLQHVNNLRRGKVQTTDDGLCEITVETVCIHGDNDNLFPILKALDQNFEIVKFGNRN